MDRRSDNRRGETSDRQNRRQEPGQEPGQETRSRESQGRNQRPSQEWSGREAVVAAPGKEQFNTQLFAGTLAGGAAGFILDVILYSKFYGNIPNIVLFGMIMAIFTLGVLGGAALCSSRYNVDFGKAVVAVIACAAIMFVLALVFEFIYELDFTPKKVLPEKVSITDYIFCIDDSGSMSSNDSADQRYEALDNILKQLDETSNVGLIRFSSVVFAKCGPAPLNSRQLKKIDKVKKEETRYSGTDFEAPLEEALKMYEAPGLSGRNSVIVLLSDGEALLDEDEMAQKCNEAGITICTVFLGNTDEIPEVLVQLAQKTGGSSILVRDADKLVETFQKVVDRTNITTSDTGDYKRFLWSARAFFDQDNILALIERVLFFTVFGLMYGLAYYIILGPALRKQRIISVAMGLLCGLILEAGFWFGYKESTVRLATVLMALVFARCLTKGSVPVHQYEGRISQGEYRTGNISGSGGRQFDHAEGAAQASNFGSDGGAQATGTEERRPGQRPGRTDSRGAGQRPGRTDSRGAGQRPGRTDSRGAGQRPGRTDSRGAGQRPGRGDRPSGRDTGRR